MIDLEIYCDEYDFAPVGKAFADLADCTVPAALEVIISDEEQIKRLNADFRKVDKVTDVLSFPTLELSAPAKIKGEDFPYDVDENGRLFLGSVVVCKQVAANQAEEYGHSFERELNYLVVHGVCHLMGFDHEDEGDKAVMRAKEEAVLKKLGLERKE